MVKRNNVLYIVVPCYNEQEVLENTSKMLKEKLDQLISCGKADANSRILFVDDGSTDKTWEIIEKLHNDSQYFAGLKLSHNKGHQNALMAGLETSIEFADAILSIDADLQDDIGAIDKMMDEYLDGAEVVYGIRSKRDNDSFIKRFTAESFYKLIKKMGVETVYNHADCRLMSKTSVECLLQYKESNLYLRGIIPQIGYKTSEVDYERKERLAGKSKYPVKKMIGFAIDGITSLSTKPLEIVFSCGAITAMLGFLSFVTTFVLYIVGLIPSLYSVLSFVLMQTGIIMLFIGIVGIYVGKNYMESKHRPRYFIEKKLLK